MKFNFENIKAFLIKNKTYVIIAAIFVIMVVTLVKVSSDSSSKQAEEAKSEEVITTIDETTQEEAEAETEVTNDLLENAYPAVNELINQYFTAMASGDIDTLLQIQNPLSEEEQAQILQKMEYIEGYNNITCYTKIGPEENSYIVFAYYEIKFINIDTPVPGETPLYVCTNEDGSLYIYNGELSPEVSSYLSSVTEGQDVVDLIHSIEAKFVEAQESDPDLKEFIQKLTGATEEQTTTTEEETTTTQEQATEEQTTDEQATQEEATEEQTSDASTEDGLQEVDETVYAAETVNVRDADNESANRLGQLYVGESAKRTGILSNGWSRIEFNGQTGYVLTEYLSSTGALQEVKYLTSTVNIREQADESSSRVGTAYLGTKVTRTAVLDNGWSRINCDGVVGYVKSEYLADTYN